MKKYIIVGLLGLALIISFLQPIKSAEAKGFSIKQLIDLLIEAGAIPIEKMEAVHKYLLTVDISSMDSEDDIDDSDEDDDSDDNDDSDEDRNGDNDDDSDNDDSDDSDDNDDSDEDRNRDDDEDDD